MTKSPDIASNLEQANTILRNLSLDLQNGNYEDGNALNALSKLQRLIPEISQELGFSAPASPSESESVAVVNAIASLNKRFLTWARDSPFGLPLSYSYLPSACLSAVLPAQLEIVDGRHISRHRAFADLKAIPAPQGSRYYLEASRHAKHAIHEVLCSTFPTCTITRWETEEQTDSEGILIDVISSFRLRVNDLTELEKLPVRHLVFAKLDE